jgi:hypothetical protein
MRKSKINLAVSREDYQKYELYFFWLKIAVLALGAVFFTTFLTFFIVLRSKNSQNTNLNNQKQDLLLALSDKKGDEVKIFYMQKKYSDLTNFIKNDASSLPYYTLLTGTLKESTQASEIKSFGIDKSRAVSFTIAFNSFPDLLNFFKFIESESFLNNFEQISLKSFSVIGSEDDKENYEISFAGKFVKL